MALLLGRSFFFRFAFFRRIIRDGVELKKIEREISTCFAVLSLHCSSETDSDGSSAGRIMK